MSFRKSFSGFRKKVKDKLSKIGGKAEGQANVGGGGFNNPALILQSEPAIAVESEFGEGSATVVTGKGEPRPDGSLSVSRSAVDVGHNLGVSGDRRATGQRSLHSYTHAQTESGPSQERRDVGRKEAERADPPPQSDVDNRSPAPSILQGGKSESK